MEITSDLGFKTPNLKKSSGDFSVYSLIASNVITIILAVYLRWDLLTTLFIYWFQNIIIGFFNFIRIISLKNFSTEGFAINDKPVAPTAKTKFSTAFFFAFHYGFFHLIYYSFLNADFNKTAKVDFRFVYWVALIFFVNHLISYIYNRPKDTVKENIGRVMFFPYARIIPMHIIILAGAVIAPAESSPLYMILFMGLKTMADVVMHVLEHA